MFKVTDNTSLARAITEAEKNYTIQKNDVITIEVYTNEGERLIDPDFRLMKDMPQQQSNARAAARYLVDQQGLVKLPMIGEQKLEGLTIRIAEALLQQQYQQFYQNPFVIMQYQNKRVVVLGAPGGQVVPLTNENMRLTEVLALAKGVNNDAKAHNIRVMRGDQVWVIDFSTIEGYLKHNMIIEPGDVVYIEPVRRPLVEGMRDYGPILSMITSIATLVIVIIGLNK
jgi:polysaccharide biosynthesis/export protein